MTLLRSPGGVYKRVGPAEELRLLAKGWTHHPPPGLPPRHGMANP